MKKALTNNGPMALATIFGLVGFQVIVGVNNPIFRYAIDGGIVVVLLAYSDQILLTCLLFIIKVWKKLNGLFRAIVSMLKRVIRYLDVLAPSKKTPSSGVFLNPLLTAVILLLAGLLSPSDGVDSGRYLPTYELLARAMIILAIGVGSFLVYMLLGGLNKDDVNRSKAQNEQLHNTDEKHSAVFDVVD